jgi:cellulose synthase/poly-beta-1,6-N-acetylglucosamine synthase-like glycosyltransferase
VIGSLAHLAELVLVRMQVGILVYFVLVNGFYGVLLFAAIPELIHRVRLMRGETSWRILSSGVAPRIAILAPAHNEAATVGESVRALLTMHYPNLEVVIANDGSTDGTLQVLTEEFHLIPIHPIYRRVIATKEIRGLYRSSLHPNLVVVDKQQGGKADALNAALNVTSAELVCAIDADTLIDPDALQLLVRPFIDREDVLAAGATVRVANGSEVRGGRVRRVRAPRRPLAGFQAIEYLRAFLFGRVGWNRLGGNLVISGAFGLFRREALFDAGGYGMVIAEDMDLVVRLRRRSYERNTPHRVEFIPDPVAWTEVPENVRTLGRQRDRWHRGLTENLRANLGLILNPRYRALGMVVYPYFAFVEWLGPLVEAAGLFGIAAGLAVGAVNVPFAVLFFALSYGLGTLLTLLTMCLEEITFRRYGGMSDRLVLLGWALLENLGYRQLTLVFRLRGLIGYIRGRTEWGIMERRGFHRQPSAPAPGGRVREGSSPPA